MGERGTKFPETDKSLRNLLVSKNNCAAYAGFLLYLYRNPTVKDRLDNSYSGHIARLQINATQESAVMLLCRIWDPHGDTIPNLTKDVCSDYESIIAQRRAWRPDWDDRLLGLSELSKQLEATQHRVSRIQQSRKLHAIRVHRTEALAHALDGTSRDRQKYESTFGDFSAANYWAVLRLLLVSANLIKRLQLHWFFEFDMTCDRIEIYWKYSRMYWSAFPKLSDVEEFLA